MSPLPTLFITFQERISKGKPLSLLVLLHFSSSITTVINIEEQLHILSVQLSELLCVLPSSRSQTKHSGLNK